MLNSTNTIIQIKNLFINYKKRTILDNINIDIKKGEFITLIGPNGAGKSTLIKAILGIININKGNIIKENISFAYMPQRVKFNELLPIQVDYFLNLYLKKDAAFYKEIISTLDISNLLYKPLASLSGGEMQKVLLARALLAKPDVLILDEPQQNLDINNQNKMYEIIDQVYQTYKMTILLVSHDLYRVMISSSRVICLYHHICCSGTPAEIKKNQSFINLFGDGLTTVYQHKHFDKKNHT